MSRSSRAFTLVELLTVIAVIGVLVAILIPVVVRVRDNARATTCLSNLRQQAVACLLFAADNRETLPPSVPVAEDWPGFGDYPRWQQLVERYAERRSSTVEGSGRTIWRCPADLRPAAVTSYGINQELRWPLDATHGRYGARLSTIRNPSRTVLIADSGNGVWERYFMTYWNGIRTEVAFRHGGGDGARTTAFASADEVLASAGFGQAAFVDGGVGRLRPAQTLDPSLWRIR